MIGGQTQSLPELPSSTAAGIVVGDATYLPNEAGSNKYLIVSQTLTEGGTVQAHGTTVALASDGGMAFVNGKTQLARPAALDSIRLDRATRIGDESYTANPSRPDEYVVGRQTLTPGGAFW